jgi:hypothetical protein
MNALLYTLERLGYIDGKGGAEPPETSEWPVEEADAYYRGWNKAYREAWLLT